MRILAPNLVTANGIFPQVEHETQRSPSNQALQWRGREHAPRVHVGRARSKENDAARASDCKSRSDIQIGPNTKQSPPRAPWSSYSHQTSPMHPRVQRGQGPFAGSLAMQMCRALWLSVRERMTKRERQKKGHESSRNGIFLKFLRGDGWLVHAHGLLQRNKSKSIDYSCYSCSFEVYIEISLRKRLNQIITLHTTKSLKLGHGHVGVGHPQKIDGMKRKGGLLARQ